jgi:hypothetical protein
LSVASDHPDFLSAACGKKGKPTLGEYENLILLRSSRQSTEKRRSSSGGIILRKRKKQLQTSSF